MPSDGFFSTFWRNSFGSDELEHYTAEYTWLANQMAHAMMAFCLVTCWALFVFSLKQRFTAEDERLKTLRKEAAKARDAVARAAEAAALPATGTLQATAVVVPDPANGEAAALPATEELQEEPGAKGEEVQAGQARGHPPVEAAVSDSVVERTAAHQHAEAAHQRAEAVAAELQNKINALSWPTRKLYLARTGRLIAAPFLLLVLKELIDIVSDISQFDGSRIPPRFLNPLLDSVTDLMFWWAGMCLALFVASLFYGKSRGWIVSTFLGFVICLGVGYLYLGTHWLNQKKTFDRSGLPLNYQRLVKLMTFWDTPETPTRPGRTPRIPAPFPEDRREDQNQTLTRIQGIAAGDEGTSPGHFVLTRGLPEDRTKLAVSLGCEFAFRLRFRERSQGEDQRRKVVYTSLVKALDDPEALIDTNSRAALQCVIIDDLDVTIDPPIKLLADATKVFPELRQYYSRQSQRKIEQAPAEGGFSDELKSRFRKSPSVNPLDDNKLLTRVQLDVMSKAVFDGLSPEEQKDEAKRLGVFEKMRLALTTHRNGGDVDEPGGKISTIWVMSNTGEKSAKATDPGPQRDNREKWMYLIAYLTGTTRDDLEKNRIEFVRPDTTSK